MQVVIYVMPWMKAQMKEDPGIETIEQEKMFGNCGDCGDNIATYNPI